MGVCCRQMWQKLFLLASAGRLLDRATTVTARLPTDKRYKTAGVTKKTLSETTTAAVLKVQHLQLVPSGILACTTCSTLAPFKLYRVLLY